LIEITADICIKIADETGKPLVDVTVIKEKVDSNLLSTFMHLSIKLLLHFRIYLCERHYNTLGEKPTPLGVGWIVALKPGTCVPELWYNEVRK